MTVDDVLMAREIMARPVVTTTVERVSYELAGELVERGYGGMPVVDGAGALIGMVSEYDLITKRGKTVGEIMSRGVISAGPGATAEQIAGMMGLHGIRRVPIVEDGRLVGLVTRTDLLRLYATTSWVCAACGAEERGLARPARCERCGGFAFEMKRAR